MKHLRISERLPGSPKALPEDDLNVQWSLRSFSRSGESRRRSTPMNNFNSIFVPGKEFILPSLPCPRCIEPEFRRRIQDIGGCVYSNCFLFFLEHGLLKSMTLQRESSSLWRVIVWMKSCLLQYFGICQRNGIHTMSSNAIAFRRRFDITDLFHA
jgi:hypothetical protein